MITRKSIAILLLLLLNAAILWLLLSGDGAYAYQKKVKLPFSISEDKEILLVYLGYVGCPTICPAALSHLSSFEDSLHSSKTQVIFVSLIDGMEQALADKFAKSFHPNFIGIQLNENSKTQLINNLLAFYSEEQPSINRKTGHSDLVYFFKREKTTKKAWILHYIVAPSTLEVLFNTYKKMKIL